MAQTTWMLQTLWPRIHFIIYNLNRIVAACQLYFSDDIHLQPQSVYLFIFKKLNKSRLIYILPDQAIIADA
jgi:hypothetical protein